MKKLSDILSAEYLNDLTGDIDRTVNSLCLDSRKVTPGALFFAVRGTSIDGHGFIEQAIHDGAVAVVCEYLPETFHKDVTYVRVTNTRVSMGVMASKYFENPSSKMSVVGVTGTNGKTTIATLLYGLFMSLGKKAGLLSTIRNRIGEKTMDAIHTTPDSIQLNELMAVMVNEGCTHCFMEVSSHAIDQQRIAGITFRGGIFTNLTHDHLDYHKTFDTYLKTKKTFFDGLLPEAFALVNKDDKNGLVMVQNTKAEKHTFSLLSPAEFRCRIVENQFHGLQLHIGGQDCWFRLIGAFNASNILAVYSTAILLGEERNDILKALSGLEPVDGRFNYYISSDRITAIVDYAHTPDALQNVLETVNSIRTHKEQLITVIGAGGNRDAAKRPIMARIACQFSDKVILTSDNPRFEDPQSILKEMIQGVDKEYLRHVMVIENRKEAIHAAAKLARTGDILFIGGKGHEPYQEIKGVQYPFDDRKVIKEALAIEG